MCFKTLFRLFAVPLAILAVAFTLALPVSAGSSEQPTGPQATLSPPTLSLDQDGRVTATTTLFCFGNTVIPGDEAHVIATVGIGNGFAGGYAQVETLCSVEPQVLTLTVVSETGTAFRPGPVQGIFEFDVFTSQTAGHGVGEIDEILLPAQAGK